MNESPPFARIMACAALSPQLPLLVREAARLAAACKSELIFLHVGESSPALRRAIESALEPIHPSVVSSLSPDGSGPRIVSVSGPPDKVIVKQAAALGADLIFAGALQEDPAIRGVIGSVARRIARQADRSVYLSIHQFPADRLIRTMVVAVNFDEVSAAMLQTAVAFATIVEVEKLHVVHEYDSYSVGLTDAAGSGGARRVALERQRQMAERVQMANFLENQNLSGPELVTACLQGRDGAETLSYAERHAADLLVSPGPRRRLGLLDRFFGHPTETLLQRFPCSVLLYRPPLGRTQDQPNA